MDKIELIRREIERLKEETSIGLNEYDMGKENGRMEVINSLLSFIDSLQESDIVEIKFGGKVRS